MDRKRKVYESMMREIEARESKFAERDERKRTRVEIDRIVRRYRDLQLAMLAEYGLTEQEKAVAFYILFGLSYADIKRLMLLEKSTINYHAHNIFKKCHVKNRNELCALVLTKMYFAGTE